jgi:hypothetical protein
MASLYAEDPGFDPGACVQRLAPADLIMILSCVRAWLAREGPEPPKAEEAFVAGAAWAMQFRWE